jgi:hypothetical protein
MNYKMNDFDTLENIKRSLKMALADYERLSSDVRDDIRGKTDRTGGVHEFFSSLRDVITEEQKYLQKGELRGGKVYNEQDHLNTQYAILHGEFTPDENRCLGNILTWDIRVELWVTSHNENQSSYFEAKVYDDDEFITSFKLDEQDMLRDFEGVTNSIRNIAREEYDIAIIRAADVDLNQEGDERDEI